MFVQRLLQRLFFRIETAFEVFYILLGHGTKLITHQFHLRLMTLDFQLEFGILRLQASLLLAQLDFSLRTSVFVHLQVYTADDGTHSKGRRART
ncbi:hypothetical protein D3C71_1651930 [compost metagenome]